jgi:hypothetical protein
MFTTSVPWISKKSRNVEAFPKLQFLGMPHHCPPFSSQRSTIRIKRDTGSQPGKLESYGTFRQNSCGAGSRFIFFNIRLAALPWGGTGAENQAQKSVSRGPGPGLAPEIFIRFCLGFP